MDICFIPRESRFMHNRLLATICDPLRLSLPSSVVNFDLDRLLVSPCHYSFIWLRVSIPLPSNLLNFTCLFHIGHFRRYPIWDMGKEMKISQIDQSKSRHYQNHLYSNSNQELQNVVHEVKIVKHWQGIWM
jgi:hypothetical protein